MQKTKMGVGEEGFLIKSFKYFDIAGKGTLPKEGFQRAIEKIGVNIEPEVNFNKAKINRKSQNYLTYMIPIKMV